MEIFNNILRLGPKERLTYNFGFWEHTDEETITGPAVFSIVGPLQNGALPIVLTEGDGRIGETVYWHQPEPRPPKP